MRPPWASMAWRVSASPMPVPRPTGLVVKNGSKMRGSTALGIPVPVSITLTSMPARSVRAEAEAVSVTEPPSPVASIAFATRFISADSMSCGHPINVGNGPRGIQRNSTLCCRASPATNSITRSTSAVMVVSSGVDRALREKSSSERSKCAARCACRSIAASDARSGASGAARFSSPCV